MIRLVGVLVIVAALYVGVLASDENARTRLYQQQLAGWLGFYGVLTVGVGVLIVAGGIDLSVGSVVGLGAICFGQMLEGPITDRTAFLVGALAGMGLAGAAGVMVCDYQLKRGERSWFAIVEGIVAACAVLAGIWRLGYSNLLGTQLSPLLASVLVLWIAAQIGLVHGLLVTRLRLQPFLVTLCGLFIYRGLAKWATSTTVGRGPSDTMRELLVGGYDEGSRNQLLVLLVMAVLLGLFLHGTRHGRYLFAIGANEDAARYAGIATDRYKVLAYIVCSGMAGLGAILFLLANDSANPTSAGSWLELYAITGAVLGGCSLRGGEGLVPGMILGAAVLPLLRALCAFNNVGSEVEYAVIGFALLVGTIADELLKRRTARRVL